MALSNIFSKIKELGEPAIVIDDDGKFLKKDSRLFKKQMTVLIVFCLVLLSAGLNFTFFLVINALIGFVVSISMFISVASAVFTPDKQK